MSLQKAFGFHAFLFFATPFIGLIVRFIILIVTHNNHFYLQISTNVLKGMIIAMQKPLVITPKDRLHVLVTLAGLGME